MEFVSRLIPIAPIVLVSFFVAIYVRSVVEWRARSRGLPLPPGPKGLPLLGNLLNAPKFKPWISYKDLSARYGSIVHIRVLGQSIVVLNSPDVIFEYLDKRSANTSDRKITATTELIGTDTNFGFQAYGTRWRQHRRAFWQHFTQRAIIQYQPVQRANTHKFLFKLIQDPSRFSEHIRYSFSATLLKILYDIDAADENDQRIALVEDVLESVAQGVVPGKFLVEFFPFLRHVPAWVPGAGFQALLAGWREAAELMRCEPFELVKRSMEKGEVRSITGRIASSHNTGGFTVEEREELAKNVGLVTFEAGSDTTFSILQATFVALSLSPDVMKKAQAELDAVVGFQRMLEFSDLQSLVYLQAVTKEAMRWHNTVPLCIPHATLDDDELHGFFVPAGTVIMPNIWACMHDPEMYENPDDFYPDRFIKDGKLDPNVRDPADYIFGFGRRICPGRHFAHTALLFTLASVIHLFDITPPTDEQGRPIKVIPNATDGILSYQEDCRCTIRPRSVVAEALVVSHASAADHEEQR